VGNAANYSSSTPPGPHRQHRRHIPGLGRQRRNRAATATYPWFVSFPQDES
jgi:hypothetical protein